MTDLTMSQFASKDDLIAAQAARIAELEAEVDAERHHHGIRNASAVRTLHALGYSWRGNDAWQPPAEQGKCLHQIAEPAAPAGKPIEDAIDALVMAAFTEGGCSEHRMSEARIQTELRKKELRTLLSTPQPCSRSHPHEEMTPMCELRTEIARLTNALARAEAAAPQAVQDTVPLFWVRLLRDGLYEGPVHNNSVGGKMLRDEKPGEWHPLYLHTAPAHPAEGVPVQAAVPVGWMNADTLRAMQDTPKSEKTRWPLYNLSELHSKSDMVPVYAATHPTQQGLDARDAARYRWLRNESWACYNLAKGKPEVALVAVVRDGACNVKMVVAEDAMDTAVDAALAAQAKQGGAA